MPKTPEHGPSEDEPQAEDGKEQQQELTETEKKVNVIASQLHDEWRKPRWKEESQSYESRVKKTKDEEWSKSHGGAVEVDIANTSYEDLPSDWQAENKASAEVAMGTIVDADVSGKKFDERFLEGASSVLHDKWLERNGSYAPPEQNKPYAELSEDEKEKDRVIIRKALGVYTGKESEK